MLNKVTLMGRLTKDPMVKYSQGGTAIARYTLAIDRRPGKNGEQVTDFIDCIAFGSSGKFVEKYLRKGRKIVACGKLELNSYTKDDGTKVYALDVVMNEHYFADDKIPEEVRNNQNAYQPANSFDVPDYSDGFHVYACGRSNSGDSNRNEYSRRITRRFSNWGINSYYSSEQSTLLTRCWLLY